MALLMLIRGLETRPNFVRTIDQVHRVPSLASSLSGLKRVSVSPFPLPFSVFDFFHLNPGSSVLITASQQDLSTKEKALGRFASRNDDSGDMEARGKELASRCFAEDEEFLAKEKIAEWLGGQYALQLFFHAKIQLISWKWSHQQSRSPLLCRLF